MFIFFLHFFKYFTFWGRQKAFHKDALSTHYTQLHCVGGWHILAGEDFICQWNGTPNLSRKS